MLSHLGSGSAISNFPNGLCGLLHRLSSKTWSLISYVKAATPKFFPFSANKLSEHISARVKVYRFSVCSQFIQHFVYLCSRHIFESTGRLTFLAPESVLRVTKG